MLGFKDFWYVSYSRLRVISVMKRMNKSASYIYETKSLTARSISNHIL
ncbi:hypothetical protein KsCSTR_02570 [Candidatus Kuenenia stuttgartiensis]|uniref:Uncharacterized protein n=1 Tax=Kuenenia stuttgartiensis TaxID=174633 RepID=A0A6G7GJA7_KUEST|nr:hypothetical protein KsCSTR_02570 [Candidatus Kuenenia stuttgartiensis]